MELAVFLLVMGVRWFQFFLLDAGRMGAGRAIFVRAQAFGAVFNQLVRSRAQLLLLE